MRRKDLNDDDRPCQARMRLIGDWADGGAALIRFGNQKAEDECRLSPNQWSVLAILAEAAKSAPSPQHAFLPSRRIREVLASRQGGLCGCMMPDDYRVERIVYDTCNALARSVGQTRAWIRKNLVQQRRWRGYRLALRPDSIELWVTCMR